MTADGIAWERTKWWQLQSELTFDRRLSERAKVRFFANGGWQLLYKPNNDTDRANVYGVGYGGRLELGPVQVKIRKFDVSAGWGITRMFLLNEDVIPNAMTGEPVNSLPMQQMGVSGGVFYHHTDYLIFGADYFLAQIKWWLGERQTLNTFNVGTTLLF